jgi:hypothetical protein
MNEHKHKEYQTSISNNDTNVHVGGRNHDNESDRSQEHVHDDKGPLIGLTWCSRRRRPLLVARRGFESTD